MNGYANPIGFIVEGHGEYNCYPSLFNKILNTHGVYCPAINANGCGTLIKHIKQHLTDLTIAHKPMNILISVDLKDVIHQNLAQNCAQLVSNLNSEVNHWLQNSTHDQRILNLPSKIVVVVQICKFETWLISDVESLKISNIIKQDSHTPADPENIIEPVKWLEENLTSKDNIKSPKTAKKIAAQLNPIVMRSRSRSFDKFYRECAAMYGDWLALQ